MRARQFIFEASPRQQMSVYNPTGRTYRQQPMPVLEPDPVDDAENIKKKEFTQMPDDWEERTERKIDLDKLAKLIKANLDQLQPRERFVLIKRFFDDMTLAEIGAELGIGIERARQIEAKALRRLRHPTMSNPLAAFVEQPKQDIPSEDDNSVSYASGFAAGKQAAKPRSTKNNQVVWQEMPNPFIYGLDKRLPPFDNEVYQSAFISGLRQGIKDVIDIYGEQAFNTLPDHIKREVLTLRPEKGKAYGYYR